MTTKTKGKAGFGAKWNGPVPATMNELVKVLRDRGITAEEAADLARKLASTGARIVAEKSALWWAATFATLRRIRGEIESVTDSGMDEYELGMAANDISTALEHFAAACPDTAARVPVPA
jgi:hypothetical protein